MYAYVLKLLDLEIESAFARKAAEKAISALGADEEVSNLVKKAFKIALQKEEKSKESDKPGKKGKTKDQNDLREISELAKKKKESSYVVLKEVGYIKNPMEEFIKEI